MVSTVKQRDYIQGFLDFTNSFLTTESVTVTELNLIKANLEILLERIRHCEDRAVLNMTYLDKSVEYYNLH